MSDPAADPVLARRTRLGRLARLGQRLGYSAFGMAMVAFLAGFVAGFQPWLPSAIVAMLAVGSALLAPAIILGYAVRAADRADREGTW